MEAIYDARGNRYSVVTPAQALQAGINLPMAAEQAAVSSTLWAHAAIAEFCKGNARIGVGQKMHGTDGLLIGPFQNTAPFDLLIINTDGSLAERSGNGLTIFGQSLMDAGLICSRAQFTLHVHHHGGDICSPTSTVLTSAVHDGLEGFWVDTGEPTFGPKAVGAKGHAEDTGEPAINQVKVLESIRSDWTRSVFVRLGNPHCVTLVSSPSELPTMDWLGSTAFAPLAAIAFAATSAIGSLSKGQGVPCPNGVNLQWAAALSDRRIMARIFERGEGPTLSSGTSACAVASAMWASGHVLAGEVEVEMPGGTAPIHLSVKSGKLARVQLFGTAQQLVMRGIEQRTLPTK